MNQTGSYAPQFVPASPNHISGPCNRPFDSESLYTRWGSTDTLASECNDTKYLRRIGSLDTLVAEPEPFIDSGDLAGDASPVVRSRAAASNPLTSINPPSICPSGAIVIQASSARIITNAPARPRPANALEESSRATGPSYVQEGGTETAIALEEKKLDMEQLVYQIWM